MWTAPSRPVATISCPSPLTSTSWSCACARCSKVASSRASWIARWRTSRRSSAVSKEEHLKRVVIHSKRAKPFYARHPWVFAGAIDRIEGEPADGDEVDLVSSAGHFVARGLYNGQSKIRVRLYSWEPDRPL